MKNKHFYFDKKRMVTKLVILLVLIILLFGFWFFTRPDECGSDSVCFNSHFIKCSKVKSDLINKDENKFNFEIKGSLDNNCIIKATLISMPESRPVDIRKALEGKSMTCSIPRDIGTPITNLDNLNDFCTGQLKEASLQITIEKMYSIIVKNIGPLASEFKDVLKD